MNQTMGDPWLGRGHRLHLPHPHLPHGLVTFPRHLLAWMEPWFLAYACLGIVQGGMLPLLLPLSASGSAAAGTIVGVMNLAGLTAPLWGHLADRRSWHRQVLLLGMFAALAALLLMPVQLGLPVKIVLAAILGLGFAAANTVANMFIVEIRPKRNGMSGSGRCRPSAVLDRSSGCCWPG